MKPTILSYDDLIHPTPESQAKARQALCEIGIIGIKDIPNYIKTCHEYIQAAVEFSQLPESIKQQYAPNRDIGQFEGYEIGVEKFLDSNHQWQIDDLKASYYAFVPDKNKNQWPAEVDLKTPYLKLGTLIFNTGKYLLNFLGLNEDVGINHEDLFGYGRMLHYQKTQDTNQFTSDWCGAHFDHSLFTGLMPAYYFKNGEPIDEPSEAGLYIIPTGKNQFTKIEANDKSVLFFQVGEFGQLISDDQIRATKHVVKKSNGNVDRYTFALFYNPEENTRVLSKSILTSDTRYSTNQCPEGSISFKQWNEASLERYDASRK
jgi:isopenicillin N synthase-like dioxygenase